MMQLHVSVSGYGEVGMHDLVHLSCFLSFFTAADEENVYVRVDLHLLAIYRRHADVL